ncbi:MAG: tRNA pseudouridine(38-40) synthase TruA [Desulfofustis sp.]|nr:tRNA pseudouridine(38-40) synthase TruA [Desulfofustis sp.]NNK56670.1 tRNA pseudouridine(38-40) synthase TruA [Desulfofustis sp.]
MRTVKLLIAFDGTGYCGWQRQKNGFSIQEEIERSLSVICNEQIILHGAGRTDAGVHAQGMTAHFKTYSKVDGTALQKGLNSLLPGAIRILEVSDQPADFHARFSALAKTYRYTIFTSQVMPPNWRLYTYHLPFKLDRSIMEQCLGELLGTHDFSSFETTGSRDKNNNHGRGGMRTIYRARLVEPEEHIVLLQFTGDGFLRHMVRNITGTVLEVGRGKRTVKEFVQILRCKDRNKAGATAPSCGLSLVKVHYQKDW